MDKLFRKHKNCPTAIGSGAGPHAYRLVCTRHNKTLRWLTESQVVLLRDKAVQIL